MSNPKKKLLFTIGPPLLILLVPLIAMQFTDEVNWSLSDFVVAALLLFGFAFLIRFVLERVRKKGLKIILLVLVLFIFVLIWAELAVGLFGTRWAGN